MFRSAACSFDTRVIGVILTGGLSDGTAGLNAIKSCGGIAVVQHPDDADSPAMVLSALRHVDVDHCLPVSGMAQLLASLAETTAGPSPEIPQRLCLEAAIAAQEHGNMKITSELGKPSVFICPECHGPLWEINDGTLLRYRCHTGHAYTADVMLEAQASEAEQILWSLLRSCQQRAELAHRMAMEEAAQDQGVRASDLTRRAAEYEADAELVEQIISRWDEKARLT